jgi:hypothetical protein
LGKPSILKQTIITSAISLLIIAMLPSCGQSDQSKAVEHSKQVQAAIKENRPGTVATINGGYAMKAKLDGKDWEAASMMPPDEAGRIIGYHNGDYIGLPYDRGDLVVGRKIALGEDNAVDISLNNGCLWEGTKGEMEITKLDDKLAEGKFFFTTRCIGSGKTLEVTDGFFRIALAKNE